MTVFFAFFTFLVAFWVMVFIAIPLSTKYRDESEESGPAIEGYAAAPKVILWKRVFIIAVVLALLVTMGLALIIKTGIISVKNLN